MPKRPFKLTKGGWIFILYTIGVGAGAINTGNNLLYLLFGIFLGLILASGFLSDVDLWHIDVDWVFPEAFAAGKPNIIPLACHNRKKWFPVISVTVQMEGRLQEKKTEFTAFLPALQKKERQMKDIVFIPTTRGIFALDAVRLGTSFPFGLLKKKWTISEPKPSPTVFVYPQLFDFSYEDVPLFLTDKSFEYASDKKGDGTGLLGIREFLPGDNPRRIHWKSSAKRGGESWLVREMEEERQARVQLRWPQAAQFKGFGTAEIEEFVSFTASLIALLDEQGINSQLGAFATSKEKMEFLAVVNPLAANVPPAAAESMINVDLFQAYQTWLQTRSRHSS